MDATACQVNWFRQTSARIPTTMKTISILHKLTLALIAGGLVFSAAAAAPKKVLVVSVTTGFRHSSIGVAEKTIARLGEESGGGTGAGFFPPPALTMPPQPQA